MVADGRGQDGAEHIRGQASAKPALARVQHERNRQQQQREPTNHRPAGALDLCKSSMMPSTNGIGAKGSDLNKVAAPRASTTTAPEVSPARRLVAARIAHATANAETWAASGCANRTTETTIGPKTAERRPHPALYRYSEHGRQEGGGNVQSQRSDPNPSMDALDTETREGCSERYCPDDDEPRRGTTRRSSMSGSRHRDTQQRAQDRGDHVLTPQARRKPSRTHHDDARCESRERCGHQRDQEPRPTQGEFLRLEQREPAVFAGLTLSRISRGAHQFGRADGCMRWLGSLPSRYCSPSTGPTFAGPCSAPSAKTARAEEPELKPAP